eukprot:ANDGO_07692.mRNA.1 hypothetical protein
MSQPTTATPAYTLTVNSQLMQNYVSGSPIDANAHSCMQMCVDPLNTAFPIVFTLGTDGNVYMFRKQSAPGVNASTGWLQTCLTNNGGLQPGETVIQFAVGPGSPDGTIPPVVALATQRKATGTSVSYVYHITDFSQTTANAQRLVAHGQFPFSVEGLATGVSSQTAGKVFIAATTASSSGLLQSWIIPEAGASGPATLVPMPVTGSSVLATTVGHLSNIESNMGEDAVLFSLVQYKDNTRQVIATSVPQGVFNHALQGVVTDSNTSALAVGPLLPATMFADGKVGGTALVVSDATGVKLFTPYEVQMGAATCAPVQLVTASTLGQPVKEISVLASGAGVHDVFVQLVTGQVYEVRQQQAATAQWMQPAMMFTNVQDFAAMTSFASNPATELVVLDTSSNLTHYVRDPTYGSWASGQIVLQNVSGAVPSPSFVLRLSLLPNAASQQQTPTADITQMPVTLSTSQVALLRYNGCAVYTDPTQTATVNFNSGGVLTLTFLVQTLVCPSVTLSIPSIFPSCTITIAPTKGIDAQFAAASSQSLQSTTIPQSDGTTKQLVPANTSATNVSAAAAALQQLASISSARSGTPVASGSTLGSATVLVDANTYVMETVVPSATNSLGSVAQSASKINNAAKPANFSGFTLQTGASTGVSCTASTTMSAPAKAVASSEGGGFFSSVGDALQHLWSGAVTDVKMAVSWVEEGISIVINDYIALWTTVIEDVLAVAHWIFTNVIEVVFDDIVAWLGKIFNWTNMVNCGKVIRGFLWCTMDGVSNLISDAASQASQGLAKLESELSALTGFSPPSSASSTNMNSGNNPSTQQTANDPHASWASDHVSNAATGSGSSSDLSGSGLFTDIAAFENAIETFGSSFDSAFASAILTELSSLESDFQSFVSNICSNPSGTSVGSIVKSGIQFIGTALIDTAQSVISLVTQLAKSVVQVLQALFSMTINIPVISPLFTKFVGEECTVINIVSFVAGVFTSILGNIVSSPLSQLTSADADAVFNCTSFSQFLACVGFSDPSNPVQTAGNNSGGIQTKLIQSSALLQSPNAASSVSSSAPTAGQKTPIGADQQPSQTSSLTPSTIDFISLCFSDAFGTIYAVVDMIPSCSSSLCGMWFKILCGGASFVCNFVSFMAVFSASGTFWSWPDVVLTLLSVCPVMCDCALYRLISKWRYNPATLKTESKEILGLVTATGIAMLVISFFSAASDGKSIDTILDTSDKDKAEGAAVLKFFANLAASVPLIFACVAEEFRAAIGYGYAAWFLLTIGRIAFALPIFPIK